MAPVQRLLHGRAEATFADFPIALGQAFGPVNRAIAEHGIQTTGPAIFIYEGTTSDPQAPFTLTTGFPTAEGTEAPAGLALRTLPAVRVVSAYYTGSLRDIGEAWRIFNEQVADAGYPTGGTAYELYLYWEGDDSDNNVVELQLTLNDG
ncbi:MAG: GyrI-like domain-containing protein [Planctomycetota bacterium]